MLSALGQRGLPAEGVKNLQILKLVDRDTTNPDSPDVKEFTLCFDKLSPYAVMEILDFSEAQQQRYLKAYDIGKSLLRKLKVYPATPDEESELYELDELQNGYKRLGLETIYDIVCVCAKVAGKEELKTDSGYSFFLRSKHLKGHESEVAQVISMQKNDLPGNVASWRAIQGLLSRFIRLKIFDNPDAKPFNFSDLTTPGKVTVIDLHDTDSPAIRNLVIADLLRGLMDEQN